MSTQKKSLRRSGAKIMASLIALLGSLSYIMVLAVINGSVGFVCAMGVTVFGAVGVAKALGEAIALSYGWIIGLTISCGVLRGLLRYFEQYSNHYIAFRLLAVLRDKIFGALRVLCPAKLESKQKGSIIAMITSDIETLEVFYAHTISPICIAVLVSVAVFLFVGFVSSWYKVYAPAGSVLAGWTGGFLGDTVKNGKIYLNEVADDSDYFTINAVYKKMLTVKYSINATYSASVIRNDSVIEGNGLDSNRTVVAKTGYTFKGWFVQGDESKTIIDLSTYKFTEDTVLVAVFTDSEGNEVW